MIDLCGLVILAFFVLMGARRGALASTLRIVGPLLAYTAAFLGAPLVGPPLAGWLELPRAAGLVLGGALLFVLVLVGFGLADGIIRARLGSRLSAWPRSLPDRLGGGLVGAAHGGLILLLLVFRLFFGFF